MKSEHIQKNPSLRMNIVKPPICIFHKVEWENFFTTDPSFLKDYGCFNCEMRHYALNNFLNGEFVDD